MLIYFLKIGLISSNLFQSRAQELKQNLLILEKITFLKKNKLNFLEKKMNELLEGTNIEKAIHLVSVCNVRSAYVMHMYCSLQAIAIFSFFQK
jgi:hypothetical protein